MNIEYHSWWSNSLQREMELKVYGTDGDPVLIFPSSSGRFFDFEDQGMVQTVSEFINSGRVTLYTVDSVDAESWDHPYKSPEEKARRHQEYDQYVVNDVVPFINQRTPDPNQITTGGVSMGAFHAVNFMLKHPDCFNGTIALSGIYNCRYFLNNYQGDDQNVYFNSPVEYMSNLSDEWYIERYRQSDIFICVGQGAWEEPMIRDSARLKEIFEQKSIPAFIDFWGHDVNHDWPWWQKQFPYFLNLLLDKRTG